MAGSRTALSLCALLALSMMSSGCLALSIQREVMESWRDPPEHINQDVTVGWTEMFETGTELDSVLYQNETNQVRYVEARLWEPGAKESGGNPFWEVRATQDFQAPYDWQIDFIEGTWILEVEARGWGITTPVEQLSFHDSFELYATITKPCVHFPSSHEVYENGEKECTFLSELED